jgi:putative transposase
LPDDRAGRLDEDGNEEAAYTGAGGPQVGAGGSDAGRGKEIADVCRELGVAEQTYYRWRNQFGGLKADDAKRLKELEKENSNLKRLLADAELEKAALKEIAKAEF